MRELCIPAASKDQESLQQGSAETLLVNNVAYFVTSMIAGCVLVPARSSMK